MKKPRSIAADPFARIRASLSNEAHNNIKIMEKVKSKYLSLERDKQIKDTFEDILQARIIGADMVSAGLFDRPVEARAMMVVGQSGAGKSHALHRYFGRHPAFPGYRDPRSDCQLINVDVRAPATFVSLGRQTLAATGYPILGNLAKHAIWERVYARLPERKIIVIHFSEFHTVVDNANKADRKDIQRTLKTLLVNEHWPVILILSGLPTLKDFIEEAIEDARRTRIVHFDSLTLPDDIKKISSIAESLIKLASLAKPDNLDSSIVPRLIHSASYQVGFTVETIQDSIWQALNDKETCGKVGLKHFARAYASRTACSDATNPFKAVRWADIDCTGLMRKREVPVDNQSLPSA